MFGEMLVDGLLKQESVDRCNALACVSINLTSAETAELREDLNALDGIRPRN